MMVPPDEADVDSLTPATEAYSVVKIYTRQPPGRPPTDPDAAVKLYEVDDVEKVSTTEMRGATYLVYDDEGNSQTIG